MTGSIPARISESSVRKNCNTDELATYEDGQRRLQMKKQRLSLSLQSAGTQLAYRVALSHDR